MGKFSLANFKKTLYYFKRNGIRNTIYAAAERLSGKFEPQYQWIPATEEALNLQRERVKKLPVRTVSIVVPTYHTPEIFLREMIESVQRQSYPHWELVLADATEDESVKAIVDTYADDRIRYLKLVKNAGISENTNAGILHAKGEYIGLLDHDDLLTEDALFEMAVKIDEGVRNGIDYQLLYSDEDKCNGNATRFYEPHMKEDFNLDLILSNNYICHFCVLKRELMQSLLLRKEYDGAQDYDLALRVVSKLIDRQQVIAHVPKVLYHWRCHENSTAENPQSKRYAYEAGKRAVQDFADRLQWKAIVKDSRHLGFYDLVYQEDLFEVRKDIGAVGGPIIQKGKIIGGRMKEDGTVLYRNLPVQYSGYMHRAVLQQDAEVLDIRNLEVSPQYRYLLQEMFGVPYQKKAKSQQFDYTTLPSETDLVQASIFLSEALRERGLKLLYRP